ncbi:UNVERIFIED_CONTAM: hypothetical protein FKN15_076443 [Acipenser sinensis]
MTSSEQQGVVKTSARCCIPLFPGCRFSRPCHPGGVPSRSFKVPSWKRRRNRPTLKPARCDSLAWSGEVDDVTDQEVTETKTVDGRVKLNIAVFSVFIY